MRIHGLKFKKVVMGLKELHKVRLIIQTRLVVMLEDTFLDFIPNKIEPSTPFRLLKLDKVISLLSDLNAHLILERSLQLLSILNVNQVHNDILEILILFDALIHQDLFV